MWLIRDHEIDGVYPIVSLFDREVRLSDFWYVNKWQKIELFFRAPAGGTNDRNDLLVLRIPRGNYRISIDDLRLREFSVVPEWPKDGDGILRSRGTGHALNVLFHMPETERLLEATLVIDTDNGPDTPREHTDSGGNPIRSERRFSITNVAEGRSISVPQDEVPPGRYRWRIEVRQYKDLLTASEWRTLDIRGEAEATTLRPVRGRGEEENPVQTVIAPIGIYNADTADFRELSGVGFNAVHISPSHVRNLREALASARESGLKVLLAPESLGDGTSLGKRYVTQSMTFLSPIETDQILAWYLEDEPEGRSLSPKKIFLEKEDLIRQGLRQPGAAALLRSWRARDYAPALDIFMSDPYPVPYEPLSWIGDCLDEIGSVIGGDARKSVWSVIQAFDWSRSKAPAVLSGKGRSPSAAELRAMTWLAIIHGARGLFYYTYRTGSFCIKDDPALWEGVTSTVRHLRANLPLMLAPIAASGLSRTRDLDADGRPAVHFAVKRVPGEPGAIARPCLIAVNTIAKPALATIAWEGREISMSFLPLEVKILWLR